ncbi:MAG: NAD(P)H-dependent oxidoreductase, partial [Actinomycetota bacterium]
MVRTVRARHLHARTAPRFHRRDDRKNFKTPRAKSIVKTLVVYAHPVDDSFNSAVRDTVVWTLKEAKHEVRLRDLYAENFDPFLSASERALH